MSTRLVVSRIALAILFCWCALASQPAPQPLPGTSTRAATLTWFESARFGMFVHWSIASVAGLEASWPIMMPGAMPKLGHVTDAEYRAFAQRFNPDRFDPHSWIRLAREAGQRYIVFTTKHHDGYCMFDSAYTKYKVTNGPYGKDIVAQLAAACKEEKMPLGLYYSLPDLDHPGYRDTTRPAHENYRGEPDRPEWPLYLDYMGLQLEELLTKYGAVPIVWFDGFKETPYSGDRFVREIHRLSPGTIIDNRLGVPGDFDISENVFPRRIPTRARPIVQGTPSRVVKADISNEVPPLEDFRPWEMCIPINETWTYNPNDKNFKSQKTLIRTLVEVASRGGNFLLDVGPDPHGTIQPEVENILKGIGRWLRVNGDAIYGTTYGPVQGQAGIRTTARGNRIYIHVFDWPSDGHLRVKGLPEGMESARILGSDQHMSFHKEGETVVFGLGRRQASDVPVIEVVLDKSWIPGCGRMGHAE